MTNSLSIPATQTQSTGTDKAAQCIPDLFFLLSRPEALRILDLARIGLKSKIDTPAEIGLTKKQYYTRLRQLVDLNLIEKIETHDGKKGADRAPVYTTTLLGNLVYERCILDMKEMISNTGKLKAAEILYQSSKFSPEEIVQFMSRYM